MKGYKEMKLNILDFVKPLNTKYKVDNEYQTYPVGGHNAHGMVERSIKEIRKVFNTVYGNLKLSLLGYETAFAWTSNELNNLPLCLGSQYVDIDHLDLITPSRLIHGRNNTRAPSGLTVVNAPSKLLQQQQDVFDSWWQTWRTEKLSDFIPKPKKWRTTTYQPKVNDIVIFPKKGTEQVLGAPVWQIARVVNVEQGSDGVIRTVTLEYRNANESTFRTTRRTVRDLAVIHREGELELLEELDLAARTADALDED